MYQSLGGGKGVGGMERFFFWKAGGGVIPVNHRGQPIDILAFTEFPTVLPRRANGEQASEKVGVYVVGRKIISDVPRSWLL